MQRWRWPESQSIPCKVHSSRSHYVVMPENEDFSLLSSNLCFLHSYEEAKDIKGRMRVCGAKYVFEKQSTWTVSIECEKVDHERLYASCKQYVSIEQCWKNPCYTLFCHVNSDCERGKLCIQSLIGQTIKMDPIRVERWIVEKIDFFRWQQPNWNKQEINHQITQIRLGRVFFLSSNGKGTTAGKKSWFPNRF